MSDDEVRHHIYKIQNELHQEGDTEKWETHKRLQQQYEEWTRYFPYKQEPGKVYYIAPITLRSRFFRWFLHFIRA